jgi:5'-phosphate synthase pdxT subunit
MMLDNKPENKPENKPANKMEGTLQIGVLALQGDVAEHIRAIRQCGANSFEVKVIEDLNRCDGLIIPGGESTTIAKLARNFGLFEPLQEKIKSGFPIFGSCAGMILLADRVLDSMVGQETFGGIDVAVRRNAFGRQVDSFESEVTFKSMEPFEIRAVFIRAPWVEETGAGVEILASVDSHPVAIRSGNLLATSFHPELTQDIRVHRYFLDEIVRERAVQELVAR